LKKSAVNMLGWDPNVWEKSGQKVLRRLRQMMWIIALAK
jgi:hypothetical protein